MFKTQGWKCTDKETLQFGRKLDETTYQYKEFNLDLLNPTIEESIPFLKDREKLQNEAFVDKYWGEENLWVTKIVNIEVYPLETIQEIIEPYGLTYDGEYITEESGNYFKDNSKLAELIFEHETQYKCYDF